jgi:GNAT superfamily N-acetyltransferase
MFSLRPALPGSDFRRVVELAALAYGQFATEADIQHIVDTKPYFYHLIVAVNEHGQVVGYYDIEGVPDATSGKYYLGLVVDPDHRNQGIGSRMFDDALTVCDAKGCVVLKASARENCPDGVRFLEHRRFDLKNKSFESVLDLSAFDESSYEGILEHVRLQASDSPTWQNSETPKMHEAGYMC